MNELDLGERLEAEVEPPEEAVDEAKLAELKTALELFPTLHSGENLAEDIKALADLVKDHVLNMYAAMKVTELREELGIIEGLCRREVARLMSKTHEDLSLPESGHSEDPLILAIERLYYYTHDLYYPMRPGEFVIPPKLFTLGYGNIHRRRA